MGLTLPSSHLHSPSSSRIERILPLAFNAFIAILAQRADLPLAFLHKPSAGDVTNRSPRLKQAYCLRR
jgi:hypothetical protein